MADRTARKGDEQAPEDELSDGDRESLRRAAEKRASPEHALEREIARAIGRSDLPPEQVCNAIMGAVRGRVPAPWDETDDALGLTLAARLGVRQSRDADNRKLAAIRAAASGVRVRSQDADVVSVKVRELADALEEIEGPTEWLADWIGEWLGDGRRPTTEALDEALADGSLAVRVRRVAMLIGLLKGDERKAHDVVRRALER